MKIESRTLLDRTAPAPGQAKALQSFAEVLTNADQRAAARGFARQSATPQNRRFPEDADAGEAASPTAQTKPPAFGPDFAGVQPTGHAQLSSAIRPAGLGRDGLVSKDERASEASSNLANFGVTTPPTSADNVPPPIGLHGALGGGSNDIESTGEQRAFGFSELGPLGRPGRSVSTPSGAVSAQPWATSAQDSAPLSSSAVATPTFIASGDLAGAHATARSAVEQDPEPLVDVLTPEGQTTPNVAWATAPASNVDLDGAIAGENDAPGEGAARPKLWDTSLQAEPGASLILSERDGSAQVIAASGGMTSAEVIQLRKITQEMLSDQGFTLSDFSVNGSLIKSSVAPIKGGV